MRKLLFALVIIGVFVCSAGEALAKNTIGLGTMQCRGVQKAIQNEMGKYNPRGFKNFFNYQKKVAEAVHSAIKEELINRQCGWCIFKQFLRLVPISEQKACGTDASPTESCEYTNPPDSQIEAAIEMSIVQFQDPWSQAEQFSSLLQQTQQILGCELSSGSSETRSLKSSTILQSEGQCAEDGVNYCGPGTSETNLSLDIINVPDCLNEDCCHHDSCYGKNCVSNDCIWTPQSQECDNKLLANCQGNGDCSPQDLSNKMAKFVCVLVNWENGTAGQLSVSARNKRINEHPVCEEPASLETCGVKCMGQTCKTFTQCNPGSGCQLPVCGTIVEGGGACIEGTTPCEGLPDCTKSDDCYEGLCFESTCCGRSVCLNAQTFCPDIGVQNFSINNSEMSQERSIGSCIAH